MELIDVAVDLYGRPLGDFTSARTAHAKQARADGDRELAAQITALRKPTVAAWAVDLLVRDRPDVVEDLLALGARLQAAQAAFDGAALRELGREQHAAVAAVREQVDALVADAGQRLSDAVHVQVEGTLRAAMADAGAAAAVRSGLLVGELVSSGFEAVDVGDAVAVPGAPSLTGTASTPAAPRIASKGVAPQPDAETDAAPVTIGRRRTSRSAPGAASTAPATASESDDTTAHERPTPIDTQKSQAQGRNPGKKSVNRADQQLERRQKAEQEATAREQAAQTKREQARREADEADQEAAAAAEVLGAAQAAADDLARRHTELVEEVEALSARLRGLRDEQIALTISERRAVSARDAAARNAEAAARRARAAHDRLGELG